MYKPKMEKDIRCPLEYGLDVFGGKWKSRIICVLADKGRSVVPILQSICQWSGIYYKEPTENQMSQCQKCDYHN